MDESRNKRLFVALALPPELKDDLLVLQPPTGHGLRPVQRDALHLTLCFIGLAPIGPVRRVLRGVHARTLSLTLAGVACRYRGGRGLLWAGVEHCAPLDALQASLVSALRAADLPVDRKRFRAHVTLARYRGGASRGEIDRCLLRGESFRHGPVTFDHFTLFSSETRPEGAVYRIEERYPLHVS